MIWPAREVFMIEARMKIAAAPIQRASSSGGVRRESDRNSAAPAAGRQRLRNAPAFA